MKYKQPLILYAFAFLFFLSCNTISHFDQYAYTQSISVKVDALNLMDSGTEDYAAHAADVKKINTELQKVYEYEKNRPKNEITTKMWTIMLDSTKNLYGGFIARWRNETKLGKTFISEEKKLVSQSFDQILQLESKKIKPSDIK